MTGTPKLVKRISIGVFSVFLLGFILQMVFLRIHGYSIEWGYDDKYIHMLHFEDSLKVDTVFVKNRRSTDGVYHYNIGKYRAEIHEFFVTNGESGVDLNLTKDWRIRDDFGPFELHEGLNADLSVPPLFKASWNLELEKNIVFNILYEDSLFLNRKDGNRQILMGAFDYMDLQNNGRLQASWHFKENFREAILVFEKRSHAILLTILQSRDSLKIGDLWLVGVSPNQMKSE